MGFEKPLVDLLSARMVNIRLVERPQGAQSYKRTGGGCRGRTIEFWAVAGGVGKSAYEIYI